LISERVVNAVASELLVSIPALPDHPLFLHDQIILYSCTTSSSFIPVLPDHPLFLYY